MDGTGLWLVLAVFALGAVFGGATMRGLYRQKISDLGDEFTVYRQCVIDGWRYLGTGRGHPPRAHGALIPPPPGGWGDAGSGGPSGGR